jgi:hypothetical protein
MLKKVLSASVATACGSAAAGAGKAYAGKHTQAAFGQYIGTLVE